MIPIVFLICLMFVVPAMALAGEIAFRTGHNTWPAIIRQSVKFGLVHCLVGVPIAAGLALILAGLFFGHHYKTAYEEYVGDLDHSAAELMATSRSAAYHVAHNLLAMGIVTAIYVFTILK